MKIILIQYRQPDWPHVKPPRYEEAIHPVTEGASFRASPGCVLASVMLVPDDTEFPVHVHPETTECAPNCPAHENYPGPE